MGTIIKSSLVKMLYEAYNAHKCIQYHTAKVIKAHD